MAPRLRAQETWTAFTQTPVTVIDPVTGIRSVVTSPTTQTLWSVCYGAGQFVAVGEAGTIITSPDGINWTLRTSGFPTRWLVGVGHGNGLFVTVGEGGLILTSPDAITWTPRNTTGTRINAVAYGNGIFLAVDDLGSRLTSRDGVAWSTGPTARTGAYLRGLAYGAPLFVTSGLNHLQTTLDGSNFIPRISPTPVALEGIAYGRKIFVAAGITGVAYTSTDGNTWSLHSGLTSTGVRGIAFFNNQFVAVGNDGGVSTSFDGKVWTVRPSGTTQMLLAIGGSNEALVAVGGGGTILRSLPAQQAPTIVVPPSAVSETPGGNVAFTVSASGTAPLIYTWRKNGQPIPGATTDTLFLPNVGAGHAGNYSVVVTNAVGSTISTEAELKMVASFPAVDPVDSSFTVSPGLSKAPRTAAVQADGKIVVGGDFLLLNQGVAQYGLARLDADGLVDSSFKPAALDPAGSVNALAIQPDGKIVIAGNFATVGEVASRNIARLHADGSLDPSFPSRTGAPFPGIPRQVRITSDGQILIVDGTSTLTRLNADGTNDTTFIKTTIPGNPSPSTPVFFQAFDLQADGKIIVGGNSSISSANLRRFNANGSLDNSFVGVNVFSCSEVKTIRVLADGRIMFAGANNFSPSNLTVHRYLSNGSPDPAFSSFGALSAPLAAAAITPEGKTWLGGSWSALNGLPRNQLARLNADGTLDPTFSSGAGLRTASNLVSTPTFLFPLDDGRALVGGDFAKIDLTNRSFVARLNRSSGSVTNVPAILAVEPAYVEVRAGEPFTFKVTATGSGPLQYNFNIPNAGGSATVNALTFISPQASGNYEVTVKNPLSTSAVARGYVRVLPSAPVITQQPLSVQTNTGRSVSLSAISLGSTSITYQWFKNGNPFSSGTIPFGQNSVALNFPSVTPADSGDYTLVLRNSLGIATSETVHLGVDETSRLGAISTRAFVGTGERIAIAGFILNGTANKRVLIRGVGPGLTSRFGLAGTLANPLLRVYDSNGVALQSNSGWSQNLAAEMEALGLFKLESGSRDAALSIDLPPGAYTAQLSSNDGGIGLGLIEIYENDNRAERLIAISTRAFVGTGDALAIPGISVVGPVAKKLLVRAVGPGAMPYGVTEPLADPFLTLIDSATGATVASNDDWSSSPNRAEIVAASAAAGEFPLPDPSKDAVLLVTVPPGNYTALVRGANAGTGVALVEVYEVP